MKRRFTFLPLAAICSILLLASCNTDNKAKEYTISGNVPSDVKSEWIYLYAIEDNDIKVIDSARIEKTSFKFKGTVPDSTVILVLHPGSETEYPAISWNVILEGGDIVVDSASQFATGTPLNDGLKDWISSIDSIMIGNETLEGLNAFFRERWAEHSGDFVGAFVLYNVAGFLEFPIVDSLAGTVPDDVRENTILKPFFEQIEQMRAMQPGKIFTEVNLRYIDGADVALSDIIGKGDWVLIDFWASWCGPCRQAMPELQRVVKSHKTLKVYGIAVSDKDEDTRQAIKNLNIKWPVIADPQAESARTYGINAIPAMILFAPDGKIAARDFTVAELETILTEKTK